MKFKKKYKVKKYRKCPFETYKPDEKIKISKEEAFPIFVRTCNFFIFLGGTTAFFLSGVLISIKSFFGFKQKVRELDPRSKRIVEFGIKGIKRR